MSRSPIRSPGSFVLASPWESFGAPNVSDGVSLEWERAVLEHLSGLNRWRF